MPRDANAVYLWMSRNIMGGGATTISFSSSKSNTELVNSLRSNIEAAIESAPVINGNAKANGNGNGDSTPHLETSKPCYESWTSTAEDGKVLYVPALDFANSQLQEEREQYDITVKLFYLPDVPITSRRAQTKEALDLVLKELHMPSIDLLIVSFPGIYFDEESEDCPDKIKSRGPIEAEPEPLETQIETWRILEELFDEGKVQRLGLSEFGTERLQPFLEKTRIRPSVDQINLRDCCSVPKALLHLAKTKGIELYVHNDTTNVLPRGTVRELLGHDDHGAGILADGSKIGEKRKGRDEDDPANGVRGEVVPQWVVKYTAVVKNRGVVENKGYFAVAETRG